MSVQCCVFPFCLEFFYYSDAPLVQAYRHLSTLTLILDQVCTEVNYFIALSSSFDFQLFDCTFYCPPQCVRNASLVFGVKAQIYAVYFVCSCVHCVQFEFVTRTPIHLVKPMTQWKRLVELNSHGCQ